MVCDGGFVVVVVVVVVVVNVVVRVDFDNSIVLI